MAVRGFAGGLSRITCVMWVAACYSPSASPGAPCGPGGECPTGQTCVDTVCVLPGGSTDASNGDVDAGMTCACSGTELVCGPMTTPCTDGCSNQGTAHCLPFTPKNAATFGKADGTDAATVDIAYDVDVDSGAIIRRSDNTFYRTAGAGVISGIYYEKVGSYALFAMASLDVKPTGELRLLGSLATIFVVDGDVTVEGVIDVSGGCVNGDHSCAGPGGGTGGIAQNIAAKGCGPGGPGADADGSTNLHAFGAGGGGFGTAGDAGAGTQGSAGAACGDAMLVPLIGGSGGGHGGNVTSTGLGGGDGGGGGGALQISASGSMKILPSGVIDAGGAGGEGDPGTTRGGGGGGAGGGILLEAASVTVTGAVVANGGGGGGHNASGDGEDGTRTTTPAKGFGTNANYKGGDGGAGTTAPTGTGVAHGGGGGGAVGRIRILGTTLDVGTSVISPPPVTGTP